jgi:hypothetical protein
LENPLWLSYLSIYLFVDDVGAMPALCPGIVIEDLAQGQRGWRSWRSCKNKQKHWSDLGFESFRVLGLIFLGF